jgi:(p)ppGpp synthase/HD superfamily hydrolase
MEIYNETHLRRADEIAAEAHSGQTRFDGSPYIEHPRRVSRIVQIQGHSICTQVVALLHDTVEDSDLTFTDLRDEGFGDGVIVPLELLTKAKPEQPITYEEKERLYFEYILDIATNDRSRAVKKADLFDNLNLTGHNNPSKKQIRNIKKYQQALGILARFAQPIV